MKIGRNDPCPCGSGKKYKTCCYLSGQSSTAVVSDDQQYKNTLEDQELLIKALNGLRGLTLDNKPHIKEYYKIRKLHSEIINAMIQHYDNGNFEKKIDTDVTPQTSPSTAIHLLESSFDFETQEGVQAFYDMQIYKTSSNTNCITEDFIQKHRYRKPEKIEFLHSMLNSKLALFEITGIDSREGYAYIRDVFTGAEYSIIDVGLSGNTNYSDFYLYTRIITHNDISFGTGLNLVFIKTDDFIQKHIQHHKKDYDPNGEFIRFTQLYNRYSQHPNPVHVMTNALK